VPGRWSWPPAADALRAAGSAGFDRLLADHRAAWAARWDAVDVQVRGDPQAQLALRFALFQLWSAIKDRGELAAGARALSGTGYSGHVFWDADVVLVKRAGGHVAPHRTGHKAGRPRQAGPRNATSRRNACTSMSLTAA
jgi:Glycosyl hydrolase family 65 central catalytic domain